MVNDEGFIYRTLRAIEDNSFGALLGLAALIVVGDCINNIFSNRDKYLFQKARVHARLEIKTGNFNENQTLDKFYEIDGRKIPVEVDGKPIEEYFR